MNRRIPVSLGVLLGLSVPTPLPAQPPSFDCRQASGAVQEMICADSALAALDRQMAAVWRQAVAQTPDSLSLKWMKAEQRGWIKGRDECWKSEDVRRCAEESYRLRIAEVQARWRLVAARGPYFFACDGNPANEVVATFFATDPPTVVLERGDETVVAYQGISASGARYEGRNVLFWNKGDEAMVTWGWQAKEMRCVVRAGPPVGE